MLRNLRSGHLRPPLRRLRSRSSPATFAAVAEQTNKLSPEDRHGGQVDVEVPHSRDDHRSGHDAAERSQQVPHITRALRVFKQVVHQPDEYEREVEENLEEGQHKHCGRDAHIAPSTLAPSLILALTQSGAPTYSAAQWIRVAACNLLDVYVNSNCSRRVHRKRHRTGRKFEAHARHAIDLCSQYEREDEQQERREDHVEDKVEENERRKGRQVVHHREASDAAKEVVARAQVVHHKGHRPATSRERQNSGERETRVSGSGPCASPKWIIQHEDALQCNGKQNILRKGLALEIPEKQQKIIIHREKYINSTV